MRGIVIITIIIDRWSMASPGVACRGINSESSSESPQTHRGIAGWTVSGIGSQYYHLELPQDGL